MTAAPVERPTVVDALDAGFLVVPGLNRWLGRPDYQQSLDAGLLESYEDYCERISQKEARNA